MSAHDANDPALSERAGPETPSAELKLIMSERVLDLVHKQLASIEADLIMVKAFLHQAGTDPEAWLDAAMHTLDVTLKPFREAQVASAPVTTVARTEDHEPIRQSATPVQLDQVAVANAAKATGLSEATVEEIARDLGALRQSAAPSISSPSAGIAPSVEQLRRDFLSELWATLGPHLPWESKTFEAAIGEHFVVDHALTNLILAVQQQDADARARLHATIDRLAAIEVGRIRKADQDAAERERLEKNLAALIKAEEAYRQQEQETLRQLAAVLDASPTWEAVTEKADQDAGAIQRLTEENAVLSEDYRQRLEQLEVVAHAPVELTPAIRAIVREELCCCRRHTGHNRCLQCPIHGLHPDASSASRQEGDRTP